MEKKYLIVGTGRCGSTFLSSLIAAAGGDFSMQEKKTWNRSSGAYEHPVLDRAYKWHRMAEITNIACWPLPKISKLFQKRCDKNLKRVLNNCTFAKTIELVWLIHSIHKLNYDIRIILSYRNFNEYAVSYTRRFGWDFDRLSRTYLNVNQTALLQMKVFGGCAISFDELTDPAEVSWAGALKELTGLDKSKLLEERDKLLKEPRHNTIDDSLNNQADELYSKLRRLQGQVIDPVIKT